jgi:hypothetical protein
MCAGVGGMASGSFVLQNYEFGSDETTFNCTKTFQISCGPTGVWMTGISMWDHEQAPGSSPLASTMVGGAIVPR